SGYKNTVAESYYLLLAERLAEEGHQEESAELSRNIMSGEYASHAKSAALAILFKNEGKAALDDLLNAAAGTNERLRYTALTILKEHQELDIPGRWVNRFDSRFPGTKAEIIVMIGIGRD